MKYSLKVVGRFAFAGWALFTGTLVVVDLVNWLFFGGGRSDEDSAFAVIIPLLSGLVGAAGGVILALVALGLERLIKRPAASAEGADELPPAPKPPQ